MENRNLAVVPSVRIVEVRGKRVMVDRDLAALYRSTPIALRQQVKRNRARFPDDFMFRATKKETAVLVSQSVIPERMGRGSYAPLLFTQEGVAMLSSVLRTERAVRINIEIMRAFVRFREAAASHSVLGKRLAALESRCDARFRTAFAAIRGLLAADERPRRRIGFRVGGEPQRD